MATAPVINRKKVSADIIPPKFGVMISRPSPDGYRQEIVEPLYQPISMTEADGGELSTLTLKVQLGSDPEQLLDPQANVDLTRWIQAGSRVRLVDRTLVDPVEWFVGYVGQDATLVQGKPQAEGFQVSVYGPEWLLAGKVVKGQWYADAGTDASLVTGGEPNLDRSAIRQTDLPCVFNDKRLPNMSPDLWTIGTDGFASDGGSGGGVFVPSDRRVVENSAVKTQAQHWTAYRALRSVLEWFDNYDVISTATDWTAIKAVLGDVTIGDVSIDGLTLLDATRAILAPLGYGFMLNVVSDGSWRHTLVVYPLKASVAGKNPYLPPIDSEATDALGSRGEVSRLDFLRDSHNIRNEVDVFGNQERVQVKLSYISTVASTDLFPAWALDSNPIPVVGGVFAVAQLTEPDNFFSNYHTKGDNFHLFRDVYRTFVFNEDGGGLDFAEFGETGVPNVSQYGLGDTLYRRPIGPRLSRSLVTNDFEPALVEMTVTTGGATFTTDVSLAFDVLKDRAGVRLRREFFDSDGSGSVTAWRPFENETEQSGAAELVRDLSYLTMLYNATNQIGSDELVLSVTGTMQKDSAVKGEVARLNTSPLNLIRQRLVRNSALQKFGIHGAALGNEDTRDDSNLAILQASTIRFADDSEIGHGSIMMHHLTKAYPPGSVIAQTSGRVLNLRLDGQRKNSAPVVRKTTHHFGETNVTEVLLDSPLLRLT